MTISGIDFVQNTLYMLYDFIFNKFRLPWTPNAYLGWVLVSFVVMGMTIKSLLNVARGISSPQKVQVSIKENNKNG